MNSGGHQHHHGIKKKIVEGIGGVVIGAAVVLLLARLVKGGKAADTAPVPAASKTTDATAGATDAVQPEPTAS